MIWLVIPTALFASARPDNGGTILLSIIGGLGLVVVFSWLPFMQARFAMTGEWRDMFDRHAIKQLYRQTPLAWFMAIATVYVMALPLYLPKVYLLPSDAMWLVTIVFIVTIYPARVLTGWVVYRATHSEAQSWFGWRWLSRTLTVPLLALYVFLLFFTPLIGEHGKGVLFEHHALLLPVPF
jgi:cytochrome b subunit of formate dehydrogenase